MVDTSAFVKALFLKKIVKNGKTQLFSSKSISKADLLPHNEHPCKFPI